MVDTRTDSMVGFVDIKNIDWNIPKAEPGAFMAAAHEGKRLASKALEAITRHGFDELKFDKLLIRTHEGNTGARREVERYGYRFESTVRKDHRTTADVIVDLLYYSRVR